MACIYSLRDPNKTPRYVGQSRNPETRYKWHIQAAKRGNKGRVYNWIRSLLKEGLMLDFEVLEDLGDAPQVEVDLAETRWITRLQLQGFDLTNCTMGGGGIAGFSHTEETKAKIGLAHKGKAKSEETKRLLSLANKGRVLTPERRKAISDGAKGRVISPEQAAETSKRMMGNKHGAGVVPSLERRKLQAKLSSGGKSSQAHLTDEQANEMRRLFATGEYTQAGLARMFEVTTVTAHRIIRAKTYRGGELSDRSRKDFLLRNCSTIMNLVIEGLGDEVVESSLSSFLKVNEDLSLEEVTNLHLLQVGEEMRFGGGAAPLVVVRRVL